MARWAMLALVTMAHGLGAFSVLSVAPLSPFLVDGLGLSRVQVGFLLPAVYLGGVAMSLSAGWMTDRLGVRPTLALGQLVAGAMVGAAALAGDLVALLVLLVFAGFGFSVLNPATGKAIVEWFPPRQRGVAMGIKQTGLTLGGVVAALTLPPVAMALGWRAALGAAGMVTLLSAALVMTTYRSPRAPSAGLPAAWPRLGEIGLFLRRPGVVVVFVCGLALSTVQASLLAYLALYARDTFGVSAVEAARLLAVAQVGGTLGRLGWGVLSDRLFGGRRRPGVMVSAALATVACTGLALGALLPFGLAVPLAFLAGAGAFGWVGLYFALTAEVGGPRHAGLLTGVAVMFAWGGVLVGPPLFGLLLEGGGYPVAWLVVAGVALAVAITLPRPRPLVQRD